MKQLITRIWGFLVVGLFLLIVTSVLFRQLSRGARIKSIRAQGVSIVRDLEKYFAKSGGYPSSLNQLPTTSSGNWKYERRTEGFILWTLVDEIGFKSSVLDCHYENGTGEWRLNNDAIDENGDLVDVER